MLHIELPIWRPTSALVRLSLLLVALGHISSCGTIVSVSGPLIGGYYLLAPSVAAASSWTSPRPYSDVAIGVLLSNGVGQEGTAYLMTRIGVGTTTASEVARTAFSFPSTISFVTLFSDLSLSAGTYYLVLEGDGTQFAGWRDAYDCGTICSYPVPTITLDTGVTRNIDLLAPSGSVNAYTPASEFRVGGGISGDPFLQYSVASTPEPGTLGLIGASLLGLAWIFARMRKSSTEFVRFPNAKVMVADISLPRGPHLLSGGTRGIFTRIMSALLSM